MDAVLDNLLSNAIKFAPLGSTVHVSVHENPPAISVGDAGPGIPLEEQNELFKKHPRISTRPTGGEESLGVGLYLAQRMARRIHGEISYRRRSDDGGSVFTVRFSPTVSPA
jgi:signal transduction histidine kinase